MSVWRRNFLALFPGLRNDAESPDFTIYMAFFELLPLVRDAHDEGDAELLAKIYGFAAWCLDQNAKDLWNAAGVAFYEHLFDSHERHWPQVVQWLSPKVVETVWSLWETQLSRETLIKVRQLINDCRDPKYREADLRPLGD